MATSPIPDAVDAADAVEPAAWTIRLEQPIDLDQIHDLHRAAFRGPQEAELVDAIRSSAAFVPELSLVAVTEDGSVLGHVLLSHIDLQPDEADAPRLTVLALAPIAVLPQHQGRGIGTALLQEGLAMADARGEPMTAVLGAPSLYGRFGFEPAAGHGVHSPYDDAGEAFQIRPRRGAKITPGTLVYPSTFSEF
jgi:putative acetyltransferase